MMLFSFRVAPRAKSKKRPAKRAFLIEALEDRSVPSGNSISGLVFVDANNNGIFDSGESPLGNVAITLVNGQDVIVGATTTAANGSYLFSTDSTISTAPTTQTQSATVALSPTNWQQFLTIPQFNPALGALMSIQVTSAGLFQSNISVTNNDSTAASITATDAGTLTLTGPGLNSGLVTTMSRSATSEVAAGSPNDFGTQQAPGQTSLNIDAQDLSAYLGTGSVTFSDVSNAQSTASGAGNLAAEISTSASAQVTVVYTYIPNNALKPGNYTIEETPPANYLDGLLSSNGVVIPNSVGTHTIAVTLTNSNSVNNDFAHLQPASLAGYVYVDAKNDGRKDAGDPGIAGITLTLNGTNDLGSVNLTTATLADGSYQFASLRPGNYTITLSQPTNYLPGSESVGTSGGFIGTHQISAIGLNEAVSAANYNFGEIQPTSIAGFVYQDPNNNGIKDSGEPGIAGTTIALTGTTINGAPVSQLTTTAADGSYEFEPLIAGTYTVTETPPTGYLAGKDSLGNAGGAIGAAQFSSIILSMGEAAINYNFAELKPASIGGYVWLDSNNNGQKDANEPGIGGVTVTLKGVNDLNQSIQLSHATAGDGSYQFTNLRPGTYSLTENPPAGYLPGKDGLGSLGGTVSADTASNNQFAAITLGVGAAGANYDFGHQLPGSLSGYVYLDANNDGVLESGESGIANVTVTLVGTTDLGTPALSLTQQTGADGSYVFTNLMPGVYTIAKGATPAYVDGKDSLGTAGGTIGVGNFTGVGLTDSQLGSSYNFAEILPWNSSGEIYEASGSTNQASFPPPDLSILSKLQFLSSSGTGSIDPELIAQATWLDGIYETTLGRNADGAGLLTWLTALHNGASRFQVVAAIWNSPEHLLQEYTGLVDQMYESFLGRTADAAGQAAWVQALLSGATADQVATALLTSAEYTAANPTDSSFVMSLYHNILGRELPPGPQETAGWIQALGSGTSRAAVVQAFLNSSEYFGRIVAMDYANILGRSVDAAGLQFWVAQLSSGSISQDGVAISILASDEFYNDAVAASQT